MKYIENATPAWSFGTRNKDFYTTNNNSKLGESNPGPGSYHIDKSHRVTLSKGPTWKFGNEKREVTI